MPQPIIIDTDPGIDDCLALLLALNSPELDVRGISISYGNTVVENAYRNAVEIVRKVKHPVRVPLGIGAQAAKVSCSDGAIEEQSQSYQRLRRELLEAERSAIVDLRREGVISSDVERRLQRDLDLEDARLDV